MLHTSEENLKAIESTYNYIEAHENDLTIVTHDGKFHADETIAIALFELSGIPTRFYRSRNIDNEADVLYLDESGQIAGKYLDHHMKENNYYRDNDNTNSKFASAGFTWTLLVRRIANIYKVQNIERFYQILDSKIFAQIDAIDNGLVSADKSDNICSISTMVSSFNNFERIADNEQQYKNMRDAINWIKIYLNVEFKNTAAMINNYDKTYDYMLSVVKQGKHILPLSENLLSRGIGTCWLIVFKDHFDELKQLKLVVYPDSNNKSMWRIQTTLSDVNNPFSMACPVPEKLRGYRWNDVNPMSFNGIKVAFTHPAGFMTGVYATDQMSALQAANFLLFNNK